MALFALLVACLDSGERDQGSRVTTLTATATSSVRSATPVTSVAAHRTSTAPASTATPTDIPDATATPLIAPTVTSQPANSASDRWLAAWNVTWESLGGIALGHDHRLYIADPVANQVRVFSKDSGEIDAFDYPGDRPGPVSLRDDLAVGPDGRIYILETAGRGSVFVVDTDGAPVYEWGGVASGQPGSLFAARAIEVAPDGSVFVAGAGAKLQKFTSDGVLVERWTRIENTLFPADPRDLAISGETLYLLADGYRGHQLVILPLDFNGNLISEPIVLAGQNPERIFGAGALTVGPDGSLFVVVPLEREVVKLAPNGEPQARWTIGGDVERDGDAIELAVGSDGRVYVADGSRKLIIIYNDPVAGLSEPSMSGSSAVAVRDPP
jgi:hypothetical protein